MNVQRQKPISFFSFIISGMKKIELVMNSKAFYIPEKNICSSKGRQAMADFIFTITVHYKW